MTIDYFFQLNERDLLPVEVPFSAILPPSFGPFPEPDIVEGVVSIDTNGTIQRIARSVTLNSTPINLFNDPGNQNVSLEVCIGFINQGGIIQLEVVPSVGATRDYFFQLLQNDDNDSYIRFFTKGVITDINIFSVGIAGAFNKSLSSIAGYPSVFKGKSLFQGN